MRCSGTGQCDFSSNIWLQWMSFVFDRHASGIFFEARSWISFGILSTVFISQAENAFSICSAGRSTCLPAAMANACVFDVPVSKPKTEGSSMRAWFSDCALSLGMFAFAFSEAWSQSLQICTQMPPRSKQISLMSCLLFMWVF